jgi:hypothetical protein
MYKNFKELWDAKKGFRVFVYILAGALAVKVVLWAQSMGWITNVVK